MNPAVILQQMTMIFLLIMTGYLLFKKKIIDEKTGKDISGIVVNVCNPALMITSVLDSESAISNRQLAQGFLIGAIFFAVLIVVALILPAILRAPKQQRGHYAMMSIFGNTGFIGIPVAAAVFGAESIIYVIIISVYFNILAYTYGLYLITKDFPGKGQSFHIKDLVNAGSAAGVVCMILFFVRPQLSVVITDTIGYIGRSTTFLSMIVIGISLAQIPLKSIFSEKRMYGFILLRQILVPIGFGLLLKPFVTDPVMYGTFILIMAMPVGNLGLMFAKQADVNGETLSKGIVLTTILSVITITTVALFV